jgi:hypothetical protein
MKEKETRKNCIMKNFTFTCPQNPIKEDEMGRACGTYREEKTCVEGFGKEK